MLHFLHNVSQKYRVSEPYPKPIHIVLKTGYRRLVRPLLSVGAFWLSYWQGMCFPPGINPAYRLDMIFGTYEKDTISLLEKLLKPGMVVFDVGAHIGYYTRFFSDRLGRSGRVYAFEANPENFSLLCRNTEGRDNIKLVNKAISDRCGEVPLYLSSKSGSHSLFQRDSTQTEVKVEAVKLDDFWSALGRPEIDLLKVDIEGAEPAALEGAEHLIHSHDQIRLVIEFSPTNLRLGGTEPHELTRYLERLGFEYGVIGSGGTLHSTIPALGRYELVNLFCWKGKP